MKTKILSILLLFSFLGAASAQQGVTVTFKNNSDVGVSILWQRGPGDDVPMATLPAGRSYDQPTYPGHIWNYMSADRSFSGQMIASANPNQILDIKRPGQTQTMPAQTGQTQTRPVQTGQAQSNIPAQHLAKIQESLGRGYDAVKATYLDPTKVKRRIFDIQPADYNYAGASGASRFDDEYSESTSEYAKYLGGGVSVGLDYGLFSGEMEMNASSSSNVRTNRVYYNLFEVRTFYSASLNTRRSGQNQRFSLPTARVNAAALQDLNGMDPRDIINNYGTHYLVGLGYGGTALFTRSETASQVATEEKMDTKVKASYGAVNGSANMNTSNSTNDSSQDAKTTFRVVGGNVGTAINAINIQSQMANAQNAYSTWAQSTGSNPGFSEILDNGLLPIWTVPGLRQDRSAALKAAVENYAKTSATPLFNTEARKSVPSSATVHLQSEYSGDFIGGNSGDFAFLKRGASSITLGGFNAMYAWAHGKSLSEIEREKAGQHFSFAAQSSQTIKKGSELRNGDTLQIKLNSSGLYLYNGANYSKSYWSNSTSDPQGQWKIWIKGVPGNDTRPVMEGDLVSFENQGYLGKHLQAEHNEGEMDALSAAEEQDQGFPDGKRRYFKITTAK